MADQACTKAQVKARLGITDVTDDAVIDEIIETITDELQGFTGRKLVPEAGATFVADTAQGHTIDIPRGVRAISSLGIAFTDQPDDGTGTYSAVAAADILLRPASIDRRPGWPATQIVLKGGPLDVRIPLRTVRNGAKIVGDFGFSPVLGTVMRIAINASVAEYLDRRQSGRAGADGIDLANLLSPGDLAALARLRPAGVGIGIA